MLPDDLEADVLELAAIAKECPEGLREKCFEQLLAHYLKQLDAKPHARQSRLEGCFELRCQSGHPGEAPVTEYNLLSFFSDINEIVLRNPTFVV